MTTPNKVSKTPGLRAAAIAAACGLAALTVYEFEGDERKASPDPIGIITACSGHTKTAKAGKVYSEQECTYLLMQDLAEHGAGIDRCITADIPLETRAAMTSFAFNVGVANYCGSTANRKLNAGDVRGACAELSKWVYAGGKVFPGLVRRRQAERALCEKGLA